MSTLIFDFLTTNGDEYTAQTRIAVHALAQFLYGEPRMTRERRMNDRKIERPLIASSWRAELCDTRGWDHRERLSEFVPTKGNEGSQGIVLRLKI